MLTAPKLAGYAGNINSDTLKNPNYRKVIATGKKLQLVLMSLKAGEEIGNEVHPKTDQFFRIEKGKAQFILDAKEAHVLGDGGAVIVPAGTYHNVINAGKGDLKLYTIYAPPEHPKGTIEKTKRFER